MDDRVQTGFLSPKKPIYHIGFIDAIVQLFKKPYEAAVEEAAYSQ